MGGETVNTFQVEEVYGLYGPKWGKTITKASVSHPAKYAPKLIRWIIEQGIERGYWQAGDLILDPFGGIGTGGIAAADEFIHWLGVELEPRFVDMARDNFEMHRPRWLDDGAPEPIIVQGDSRQFADIVTGLLEAEVFPGLTPNNPPSAVTSPPYGGTFLPQQTDAAAYEAAQRRYEEAHPDIKRPRVATYGGNTPGQIGNLPGAHLNAVSSPPYGGIRQDGGRIAAEGGGFTAYTTEPAGYWHTQRDQQNIGNLKNDTQKALSATIASITSPPYANRVDDHGTGPIAGKMKGDVYGSTPGQMGNLRTGAVTSPPYADMDTARSHTQGKSRTDPDSPNYRPFAVRTFDEYEQPREYGDTPGQIGKLKAGAITSPPFSQPETRDRYAIQPGVLSDTITRATTVDRQGQMDGNISRLNGITSPPYEGGVVKARSGHLEAERLAAKGLTDSPHGLLSTGEHAQEAYSHDKRNLGNQTGETYWDAVEQVYRQVHQVLPVGGVFAVVVKDFVRNKQIVPLVEMTRELLEHIGFRTLCHTKAMLVSEDGTRQYKSFFRRNAERKGSPPIDWESVLWMERL